MVATGVVKTLTGAMVVVALLFLIATLNIFVLLWLGVKLASFKPDLSKRGLQIFVGASG